MTKGPVASASLKTLRQEIDGIDGELHRLIQRRAEIVETLGEIKKASGDGHALRPGREAQILRRLAGTHSGAFPLPALMGVWRTMMTAYLRMQHPIEVRVAMNGDVLGVRDLELWDLARVHFGADTPMTPTNTAKALAEAAGSDRILAVLPAPSARNDWWRSLGKKGGLMALARLPFFPYGGECPDTPGEAPIDAYVVASAMPEPSGDDTSWLSLQGSGGSLDRFIKAVSAKPGLELSTVAAYNPPDRDSGEQRLVATPGHTAPDSEAFGCLGSLAAPEGIAVRFVGCFARPLQAADASS